MKLWFSNYNINYIDKEKTDYMYTSNDSKTKAYTFMFIQSLLSNDDNLGYVTLAPSIIATYIKTESLVSAGLTYFKFLRILDKIIR